MPKIKGTPKTVARWMNSQRRQVSAEHEYEFRLVAPVLGEMSEPISSWSADEALQQVDQFADQIVSAADGDVEGRGTVMTYKLQLVRTATPTSSETLVAVTTIRRLPPEEVVIEEPTSSGQMAQLMRHNEALVRLNAAMVQQFATLSARQAEAAVRRAEILEKERTKFLLDERQTMQALAVLEAPAVADSAAEERRERTFSKLEKLLEMFMMQWMQEQAMKKQQAS